MIININREDREFSDGLNLNQVLEAMGQKADTGVAVALNSEVIPRTNWNRQFPESGDRLTVLKAVQGG